PWGPAGSRRVASRFECSPGRRHAPQSPRHRRGRDRGTRRTHSPRAGSLQLSKAWRVCRAKYAKNALDGEGARLAGGRWNAKGTRLVYTSESVALATLE